MEFHYAFLVSGAVVAMVAIFAMFYWHLNADR